MFANQADYHAHKGDIYSCPIAGFDDSWCGLFLCKFLVVLLLLPFIVYFTIWKRLLDCGLKNVFNQIMFAENDHRHKKLLGSLAIGIPIMIVMLPITLLLTVPTMIFIIGR
jgi:hypothetical protein